MGAVGGSILEVTLDGRGFGVASDGDAGVQLQSYVNELQANGNKTARQIKVAAIPMIDSVVLSVDDDLDDLQFLAEKNDQTDLIDITVALASGAILSGRGMITGEFKNQTQATTAEMAFQFSGSITKG